MAIAGEKRDEGEQDGGEHRDPTLTIESKQDDSQPISDHQVSTCVPIATQGCLPSDPQAHPPASSCGPPVAENSHPSGALTTYSRNNSRTAFTRPPASISTATTPAA